MSGCGQARLARTSDLCGGETPRPCPPCRPKAAELAPGGLVVVDTPSAVVQVEPYVESEASSVMGGYAASSSNYECAKDHNSVTIKADTSVKDAAGAIVKVRSWAGQALRSQGHGAGTAEGSAPSNWRGGSNVMPSRQLPAPTGRAFLAPNPCHSQQPCPPVGPLVL